MSPQNTLLFNVLPLRESSSSSTFKYQSTSRSHFRGEGGVAAADFHAALQLRLFLLCLVVLYKYSTALIHSRDDVRDDRCVQTSGAVSESYDIFLGHQCWFVGWSAFGLGLYQRLSIISSLLQHSVMFNIITQQNQDGDNIEASVWSSTYRRVSNRSWQQSDGLPWDLCKHTCDLQIKSPVQLMTILSVSAVL